MSNDQSQVASADNRRSFGLDQEDGARPGVLPDVPDDVEAVDGSSSSKESIRRRARVGARMDHQTKELKMRQKYSCKGRARIIGMDCMPATIVWVARINGVYYYDLSGIVGVWPSWLVVME